MSDPHRPDVPRSQPGTPSWAVLATLLVAMATAYWGTLSVPFLLDDDRSIVDNASLHSLADLRATFTPPADSLTRGRPLANFTYAVSYALSGLHPGGYHALNLAIHSAAALALYGVVRRTLRLPGIPARLRELSTELAGAVAVGWAVHPLLTQSVTYLSQRSESLMALFYLLALYALIRASEAPARAWAVGCVAFAALGALTKEVIATAPVVLLAYDRAFLSGTFRAALRARWKLYAALALIWPLLAFLLADVKQRGVGAGLGIEPFHYLLTQTRALCTYLSLSVWPHPLIFDYPPHILKTIGAALPYLLMVAPLVVVAGWTLVRWPRVGFVAAWFFVLLLPTSSIVPVTGAPLAENRVYLPLAGVVSLLVVGAFFALGPRVARLLCVTAVVANVALTFQRNRDYLDAVGLWSDTVVKAPDNPRAHNNLAVLLEQRPGGQGEALRHYQTAVRLRPDYAEAHNNLANLLDGYPGRREEALEHYRIALKLKPELPQTHHNLGTLLARMPGREAEAIMHLETALSLRPRYADAHANLGFLLAQRGRESEARSHYDAALRLDPLHPEANNNLGLLLARDPRQFALARQHFERAVQARPSFADAQVNLGKLLALLPDQQVAARAALEAALRIDPNHVRAHNNLGLLLARDPARTAEAQSHYETALRLNPGSAEAHYNLGNLFANQPGRETVAIDHFETALRLQPDYAEAHNDLGDLLSRLPERRPEALAHFQAALRQMPNNAVIHFNLAEELERLPGRKDEALEHYAISARLDPNFAPARDALRRLQSQLP